jgi:ribonuclease BN (tRNA processing enzyme)
MEEKSPLTDTITFLGTGGARFMIITQLLASGGFWMDLGGTDILVDPGPGCIVQATKRKLNPQHLQAIILSHRHLDHSGDANIMVEAMTNGGMNQHGKLFAPADALNFEPVVYSYLRDYLDGIEILQAGNSYSVGDVSFTTPVKHIHQVDTYGIIFKTPRHTFSYIADTLYFDELLKYYKSELLIINLVFMHPMFPSGDPLRPVNHLSVPDAEHIIRELKPKAAILTHFGMSVWRAQPWKVAEALSQSTGIKVIAARDGMKFDLATMEDAKD